MAEDLDFAREQLSNLIVEVDGLEVRFVAQDAMALLQAAGEWRPDVAILDVRIRGMVVLGALATLKAIWPGMAVVVSATHMDPFYRAAFLRHGADCVFDKSLGWNGLMEFLKTDRRCANSGIQSGNTLTEELLK